MKPTRLEVAVLAIIAAITIYRNLVPPLIGLADSGDFGRLLPQAGLAHISQQYDDRYFLYFNSRYRVLAERTPQDPYITSTLLPVRVARWLSIRAGQYNFFDIRVLAALQALIFLFGIWLVLVGARSLPAGLRITLSLLLVLIFTSAGYLAYFNSFYSEPTALCFLLVTVGLALILITRHSSSIFLLTGYYLAAGMVVTAKPQYAPLAPLLGVFGIYSTRGTTAARRWTSVALAVALCGGAFWYYRQTPRHLRIEVAYIGIFTDMLPHSPNPQEDLAKLGLNPAFAAFSGTTPYQLDSPLNVPEVRSEFVSRIRPYTLPLFYVSHPARLLQLCRRSAARAFTNQVPRLGYYEASTGMPPRAHPPQTWDSFRQLFRGSILVVILFFTTGLLAVALWMKTNSEALKGVCALYLLFVLTGVVEFFVPVLSQGEPDLEKHLWMFNLSFDICLILVVLGTVHLIGVVGRARSIKIPGSELVSRVINAWQ